MMREVDVLIGRKWRGWQQKWDMNRHIRQVWLRDGGAFERGIIMRWQVRRD